MQPWLDASEYCSLALGRSTTASENFEFDRCYSLQAVGLAVEAGAA